MMGKLLTVPLIFKVCFRPEEFELPTGQHDMACGDDHCHLSVCSFTGWTKVYGTAEGIRSEGCDQDIQYRSSDCEWGLFHCSRKCSL